ncbi:MAG: hypothetical protein B1H07_02030 [Campylobacteraceae bacterium 4484_166]|nr:MAG: hypothetical protein B1H07_02030 [Campylobacteraceae bacterium 4484_166]
MYTKQTITYKSDNRYFAGFLQKIINNTDIDAKVSQTKGKIELYISTKDDKKVELFNNQLEKYLPYSIFLGDIKNEQIDKMPNIEKFKTPGYEISPCLECLEQLSDPASVHYLDESLICDHYTDEKPTIKSSNTTFSPHFSQNDSMLITNVDKLDDMFELTALEKRVLYSIEKPTIKATIKDETIKNLTNKKFIYIKAPFDNRSYLISLNAKESGIDYLFFDHENDLNMIVVKENISIIKASRVAQKLQLIDKNSIVNRFLNIKNEANYSSGAIGIYFNQNKIAFLVSNELDSKIVIDFQLFDSIDCLNNLYKNRPKICKSFEQSFPNILTKIKNNKLTLFETISYILGLEDIGFEAVCDKSYEFRGNGGLKIDTNFIKNEDKTQVFDFEAFLGSIMSFKLASVDRHFLAYSIFESLADMAIMTMNQLKLKFKINNFIMMGDMFGNSVFYSRILSKFQLSNPYFAKSIALDK